jgi:hypothetical protein
MVKIIPLSKHTIDIPGVNKKSKAPHEVPFSTKSAQLGHAPYRQTASIPSIKIGEKTVNV